MRLLTIAFASILACGVSAAPLKEATLTRKQNRVDVGDLQLGEKSLRGAQENDVIKDSVFLKTGTDSRAELRYPDRTLVRVGQNSVFSFDSESRTLTLRDGTMVFSMPKGVGGATIRTPSITAAITGTTCKVATDRIAVLEGELTLQDGRKVFPGEFIRRELNGTETIARFDMGTALDGKLTTFNGPLPSVEEIESENSPQPPPLDKQAGDLDRRDRPNTAPGTIERLMGPSPEQLKQQQQQQMQEEERRRRREEAEREGRARLLRDELMRRRMNTPPRRTPFPTPPRTPSNAGRNGR